MSEGTRDNCETKTGQSGDRQETTGGAKGTPEEGEAAEKERGKKGDEKKRN